MFLRPAAPEMPPATPAPGVPARDFHRRLPGYRPTPLRDLPTLAAELGVRRVLVKDESERMGLPAFKILGASWGAARALAARFGLDGDPGLEQLAAAVRAASGPVVLTTATEGNHGRALARFATWVGAEADIFVPDTLNRATTDLIAGEGATVIPVAGDYDTVVRCAAEHARRTGAELVQDTAWDGYEQVPGWVVDGYRTMLAEIDEETTPDLVVVPVGVGSLAQAVASHYPGRAHVAAVEPDSADPLRRSLLAGSPITVATGVTSMAGLNCGTVSSLARPHLNDGLSAAVAVSEDQAKAAVADLAGLKVSAGPCGAATLAAARLLPLDRLGLGASATVVLLSTEGSRPDRPAASFASTESAAAGR